MELSNNSKLILAAIHAGANTTKLIAEHTHLSCGAVTGSMATLKKNNFAQFADGVYSLGDAATELFPNPKAEEASKKARGRGRLEDVNSKAYKSRALYAILHEQGMKRGDIIKTFMTEFDLSAKAASTYIQNARQKMGLIDHKLAA